MSIYKNFIATLVGFSIFMKHISLMSCKLMTTIQIFYFIQQGKLTTTGEDNSNAVHQAKAGLNTAVGAYGQWVNPAVGVIYFGSKAFYPGGVNGSVLDQGKTLAGLNETCGCDAAAAFY